MVSQRRKPESYAKISNSERDRSLPLEQHVNNNMSKSNTILDETSSHFEVTGVTISTMITFPLSGRLFQQFFRIRTQSSSVQSCNILCN